MTDLEKYFESQENRGDFWRGLKPDVVMCNMREEWRVGSFRVATVPNVVTGPFRRECKNPLDASAVPLEVLLEALDEKHPGWSIQHQETDGTYWIKWPGYEQEEDAETSIRAALVSALKEVKG